MTEQKGVVYGPKADQKIQKTVREMARRMMNERPQRGRWQQRPSGGGETQIINFQITSSDPNTRRALVQVEQRAFRGQVYGSILNDEVVYVYDTRGCYLNKKNEDLTGRFGSAVLMYTDDAAAELHFSEQYEPPEKYWCVLDVCCPNIVCED